MEERYRFGAEFDDQGIRQFMAAMDSLPQRMRAIFAQVQVADPQAFAGQGRRAADAMVEGMRRTLSGQQLNLNDFVRGQLGIGSSTRELEAFDRAMREVQNRFRATSMSQSGAGTGLDAATRDARSLESAVASANRQLAAAQALLDRMRAGGGLYRPRTGDLLPGVRDLANQAGWQNVPAPLTNARGQVSQQASRAAAIRELEAYQQDLMRRQQAMQQMSGMQQMAQTPWVSSARVQQQQAEAARQAAAAAQAQQQASAQAAQAAQQQARAQVQASTAQAAQQAAAAQQQAQDNARLQQLQRVAARLPGQDPAGIAAGLQQSSDNSMVRRFASALSEAQLPAQTTLAATQAAQGRRSAREQAVQDAAASARMDPFEFGQRQQREQLLNAAARAQEQAARRQERAAAEQEAAQRRAQRAGLSPAGRFVDDFRTGLRGNQDRAVAEQLGQTARFAVQYGAAYRVMAAMEQAVGQVAKDFLDLSDATADLSVITNYQGDQLRSVATGLAASAVEFGFLGSQGVAGGARAIGYYGLSEAPQYQQERMAQQSVETSARIAFLAGQKDFELIQQQLVGSQRSFMIPDQDLQRIEDSLAVISKASGRPSAEILAATTEIGTLAQNAGFDIETVMAMIGTITGTTGQTPQATAGALSQVLSKSDDASIQRALREVGVDTQGTSLAEQIEQLSNLGLSQAQLSQVVQKFGRGRSGQALQVLLEQQDSIQATAEKARSAESGTGQGQFDAQTRSVAFQLRQFGREIVAFGSELANSGILAPLGALLAIMRGLTIVATEVLRVWNELPAVLRYGAIGAVELLVALNALTLMMGPMGGAMARLVAGMRTWVGVSNLLAVAEARVTAARAAGTRLAATQALLLGRGVPLAGVAAQRAAAAGGATAAGAGAATATAAGAGAAATGTWAAAAGAALAPLIVPMAIAAAAGYTMWQIGRVEERRSNLATTAEDANLRASRATGSATEKDAAAAAQRDVTAQALEAQKFQWSDIGSLWLEPLLARRDGSTQDVAQEFSRASSARLAWESERLSNAEKADRGDLAGMISFDSVDAVTQSLGELESRSMDSASQLMVLNEAFDRMVTLSGRAGDAQMILTQEQEKQRSIIAASGIGAGFDELVAQLSFDIEAGGDKESGAKKARDRLRDILKEDGEALQGIQTDFEKRAKNNLEGLGTVVDGVRTLTADDERALGKRDAADAKASLAKAGITADAVGDDYFKFLTSSIQSSMRRGQDQFGEQLLTPQGIRGFYESASRLAQETGQRTSLLAGGNNLLGASVTLDTLEAASLRGETAVAVLQRKAVEAQEAFDKDASEVNRERLDAATENLAVASNEQVAMGDRLKEAQALLNAAKAQRIQSEAAFKASTLRTDDTSGRNEVALTALRDQRDVTTDVDERLRLDAQINDMEAKVAKDEMDRIAALSLANIDPQNSGRRLTQELASARAKLVTLTEGSAEQSQVREQIAALEDQVVQFGMQRASLAAQLTVGVRDQRGQLGARLEQARAQLAFALSGGDELGALQARLEIRSIQDQLSELGAKIAAAVRQVALDPRDVMGGLRAQLADARDQLSLARAGGDELGALQAQAEIRSIEDQMRQEGVAITTAWARSGVTSGDSLGSASVDIYAASLSLQAALPGTREYFEALGNLRQAQAAYADVVLEHNSTLRKLSIDITDPVANALAELESARANLAAADSPFEQAKASLDVRNAEANAEQAAFQQRIGDLQTNEQLGRLSFNTYMSYLQSERDRLAAIGNRTRQQQDQLNEVDKLMQAAAEQMSGQFNLGDIKLPTVYEVRRAVGAQLGAYNQGSQQTVYQSTVTISGVDFGAVVGYLQSAMGGPTGMAASTLRRA